MTNSFFLQKVYVRESKGRDITAYSILIQQLYINLNTINMLNSAEFHFGLTGIQAMAPYAATFEKNPNTWFLH